MALTSEWPVTFYPEWRWARPVLALAVWPFYALRYLCELMVPRGQPLPGWMQAALFLPAVLFLALPTWLYERLGLLRYTTAVDTAIEEATHGPTV